MTPADGMTWIFRVARAFAFVAAPAVTTAVPDATAVATPSATRTTRGFELAHVMASSRASFEAERAVAARRMRCPASIFDTAGVTLTDAAGPGRIRTSIFSTTGRPPGIIAVTAIGTVPGEPARTQPNESTEP